MVGLVNMKNCLNHEVYQEIYNLNSDMVVNNYGYNPRQEDV